MKKFQPRGWCKSKKKQRSEIESIDTDGPCAAQFHWEARNEPYKLGHIEIYDPEVHFPFKFFFLFFKGFVSIRRTRDTNVLLHLLTHSYHFRMNASDRNLIEWVYGKVMRTGREYD